MEEFIILPGGKSMSYIDIPGNWKYTENVRFNRNLYSSIITRLSLIHGLIGRELRIEAAKEFREIQN